MEIHNPQSTYFCLKFLFLIKARVRKYIFIHKHIPLHEKHSHFFCIIEILTIKYISINDQRYIQYIWVNTYLNNNNLAKGKTIFDIWFLFNVKWASSAHASQRAIHSHTSYRNSESSASISIYWDCIWERKTDLFYLFFSFRAES